MCGPLAELARRSCGADVAGWLNATVRFQATLNRDNSQYVDTWHYPDGGPPDGTENIVYTLVEGNG